MDASKKSNSGSKSAMKTGRVRKKNKDPKKTKQPRRQPSVPEQAEETLRNQKMLTTNMPVFADSRRRRSIGTPSREVSLPSSGTQGRPDCVGRSPENSGHRRQVPGDDDHHQEGEVMDADLLLALELSKAELRESPAAKVAQAPRSSPSPPRGAHKKKPTPAASAGEKKSDRDPKKPKQREQRRSLQGEADMTIQNLIMQTTDKPVFVDSRRQRSIVTPTGDIALPSSATQGRRDSVGRSQDGQQAPEISGHRRQPLTGNDYHHQEEEGMDADLLLALELSKAELRESPAARIAKTPKSSPSAKKKQGFGMGDRVATKTFAKGERPSEVDERSLADVMFALKISAEEDAAGGVSANDNPDNGTSKQHSNLEILREEEERQLQAAIKASESQSSLPSFDEGDNLVDADLKMALEVSRNEALTHNSSNLVDSSRGGDFMLQQLRAMEQFEAQKKNRSDAFG